MAGKSIVITGANGGLGRALAQRFVADGETVFLLGRSMAKISAVSDPLGDNAIPVECDVTSPDSVRAAFARIAETSATIDVLINNAAIFKPFMLETASDEQIVSTVMTNLAGPIFCARSAIPMLSRGGHIINLSSESIDEPFPYLTLYQSTKAGLETFAHQLHREVEDKGIRVTTVRAGQMMGPDTVPDMDPEFMPVFGAEAMRRGLNLMARGITQYASTLDLFRTLVDLPADMHVGTVRFRSRPLDM